MSTADGYKRWYDRQPRLSQSVRVMMLLPDEIKSIVSNGMIHLANMEYQVSEKMHTFRTLGTDKVMGLHMSKNRRREYDQNDLMHKMMNYLYILSESNQDAMANHVLTLMSHIQDYLQSCKVFKAEADMETVAEITTTYVEKGSGDVRQFLEHIKQKLHEQMLIRDDAEPIDFIDDVMGLKVTSNTPVDH